MIGMGESISKDTKIEGSQQTNSGSIPTKLLGQLLRFVGENPSDAEVQVKVFTAKHITQGTRTYIYSNYFTLRI